RKLLIKKSSSLYGHRYLHIFRDLMQLLRFHSVHLLNIPRAVEECSVKSKVLPILQVHFPTYLSSAVGLKDGLEIYESSDFVHLQNAVFAKSAHTPYC